MMVLSIGIPFVGDLLDRVWVGSSYGARSKSEYKGSTTTTFEPLLWRYPGACHRGKARGRY